MKLTVFLILFGILRLSAGTYTQADSISLDLSNATCKEALDAIKKQTKLDFFYNNQEINAVGKVSVHCQNVSLDEALRQVLGKKFTFRIVDNTVVIRPQETKPDPVQQRVVKGVVVDVQGLPLPGVTVLLKGTTLGASTDMDGKFTLSAFPNQELEVSYLGYQNARIKVTDKSTYVIRMKPKIDELEEVTVVAFAKQKKESVIASVSTIKPAELKVPSSNLTTALAGRMSGIISYQTSGEPGKDNAQFFVRGVTTFEGETRANPLILIDGIEMGTDDLARLQTDDIASFSVMKDATAAALYGSRGANGVILVSTKQGSEGKAKVSIRYELAMSRPTRTVDLADPITYMKLHNEAVRTRDPLGALPYSEEKIASTAAGLNPQVYPAIDWKEMLFKDQAINHRFNFNISGGGKVARYYLSVIVKIVVYCKSMGKIVLITIYRCKE